MTAPAHYPTTLAAVDAALSSASKGSASVVGRSVGGRDISCISYGELEPIEHTANLSSALSGRQPEAFFGAQPRQKPVMLITAAAHGAEMESIAGVLNLISVLETGADLKGETWPDLAEAAGQLLSPLL